MFHATVQCQHSAGQDGSIAGISVGFTLDGRPIQIITIRQYVRDFFSHVVVLTLASLHPHCLICLCWAYGMKAVINILVSDIQTGNK